MPVSAAAAAWEGSHPEPRGPRQACPAQAWLAQAQGCFQGLARRPRWEAGCLHHSPRRYLLCPRYQGMPKGPEVPPGTPHCPVSGSLGGKRLDSSTENPASEWAHTGNTAPARPQPLAKATSAGHCSRPQNKPALASHILATRPASKLQPQGSPRQCDLAPTGRPGSSLPPLPGRPSVCPASGSPPLLPSPREQPLQAQSTPTQEEAQQLYFHVNCGSRLPGGGQQRSPEEGQWGPRPTHAHPVGSGPGCPTGPRGWLLSSCSFWSSGLQSQEAQGREAAELAWPQAGWRGLLQGLWTRTLRMAYREEGAPTGRCCQGGRGWQGRGRGS